MKLYINTTSNQSTTIRLGDKEWSQDARVWHSQVVLPMIDQALKKQGKKLTDITAIELEVAESGSLTGQRVGQAIANALSFALKVPVKTCQSPAPVI